MTQKKQTQEEFRITGDQLVTKVKELIKEGNVRKIGVKDKHGKTLIEFPVTIGVVGMIVAPVFAAISALAALLTECTIVVTREEKTDPTADDSKKDDTTKKLS